MDRPYATPDGVRAYLSSLAGLHALRDERRLAAARYERLPAYVVSGAYVLTEDGRFGELTGVAAQSFKDDLGVVAVEEFDRRGRLRFGERWRFSYKTPAALAPCDGLCPECGQGWTYQQRADVVDWFGRRAGLRRDASCAAVDFARPMHSACHAVATARDDLRWAEDTLDLAGYEDVSPEPCPPAEGGIEPWFRAMTWGGEIRFGLRMNGFGIDWSATGRELPDTFCRIERHTAFGPVWNEPPVGHGPFHVEPLHEGWLILYLRRLRETLGL